LRNAQARGLRTDPNNRFALLLAFGQDCAGAVSVVDPAPVKEPTLETDDSTAAAALGSRGSLSGVQPKLLAVKDGDKYRPARRGETSRFIAKLPSGALRDIVENEYLTTIAVGALLPDDSTVEAKIARIEGVQNRALLVKRFDRLPSGARIHFEEFNQLLGRRSGDNNTRPLMRHGFIHPHDARLPSRRRVAAVPPRSDLFPHRQTPTPI